MIHRFRSHVNSSYHHLPSTPAVDYTGVSVLADMADHLRHLGDRRADALDHLTAAVRRRDPVEVRLAVATYASLDGRLAAAEDRVGDLVAVGLRNLKARDLLSALLGQGATA